MIVLATEDFVRARLAEMRSVDTEAGWEPWSNDSFMSALPNKFAYSHVAMDDGKIIGFLIGSRKANKAHIHRLVVRQDSRSRGVGAGLVEAFSKAAHDARVLTLKVALGSRATRFYERLGFRFSERLEDDGHHHLWRAQAAATMAVHQPNFLPWHGFFGKMSAADVFVILDDVQMPIGRSYVSRTRVRLGDGEQWLSLPVVKRSGKQIREIEIADDRWAERCVAILRDRYGKWPHFDDGLSVIEPTFSGHTMLGALNTEAIMRIARYLGLEPIFERSSRFQAEAQSDERIIEIMGRAGVNRYISGAGGMNYQSLEKFAQAGAKLSIARFQQQVGVPRPEFTALEVLFAMARRPAGDYIRTGVRIEDQSPQSWS